MAREIGRDRALDVRAGVALADQHEADALREEWRYCTDQQGIVLLDGQPADGPDDERARRDTELGAHTRARLGVGVKGPQGDAVRDDAEPPLRHPLLDARHVRRLRGDGHDRMERPDHCACRPQGAPAVDVRAVFGVHPPANPGQKGRGHGMKHGRRVVRVHDVRPRLVQELREASHQGSVRVIPADRVVNGDPVRLGAKVPPQRERHDEWLVPARGELVRQIHDKTLLAPDAEPLHDVDDAHSRRGSCVARGMRVLVITKIFPSSLEPLSAPFNLQQVRQLATRCDVEVLEAIPHVPLSRVLSVPARAARLASLPVRERVQGIDVTYLRQLYVPRVGLPVAVPLYLASLVPHRERLRAADVVFATWAYPDGCAAILAARALNKPCVVKVHGSDVNVVLRNGAARALAARILPMADAVVAVSRPLLEELVRIGVPRERVHLVANGVDGAVFYPRDRAAARRDLGIAEDARLVLFVGRLEPQKGIHELLNAFDQVRARVPRASLALVGEGVSMSKVRARVESWGDGAGRLLGARPHAEVAKWMGACDVMTLPSWAEGTPNVVLEALASGRPVVASRVGGIPDLLPDQRAGAVVPPRDEQALAGALASALERPWDGAEVQAFGPWSWEESAGALCRVLARVHEQARGRAQSRAQIGTRAAHF